MKAGQGQTLIDVATERSGTAGTAWEIAVRSGVGLTDDVAGVELDVPSVAAEPDTAAAMAASGARPACDGRPATEQHTPIGLAKIGTNNKIA